MPAAAPSYPLGPYRFINREFMIVTYETDPVALRAAVPEPLEPNTDNLVLYEWIKMPDSSGFGDYTESGIVIPCTFNGEPINYTAQMYLDDQPPIDGGREIWGFPKKYALPKLIVASDTLTGTLSYAGQTVAMGTMAYKWAEAPGGCEAQAQSMTKTSCNLKIIPDVDGSPKICQLVAYNLEDITVKGSWVIPARLLGALEPGGQPVAVGGGRDPGCLDLGEDGAGDVHDGVLFDDAIGVHHIDGEIEASTCAFAE